MSAVLPPNPPLNSAPRTPHAGPLDWRTLIEWLREDGLISAADAERTIARCSQVQSAQHPLVRLANFGMPRVLDGKPLDIESMSQWLAERAGLQYLRIDPLKVDMALVTATMSVAFATHHKILPIPSACASPLEA